MKKRTFWFFIVTLLVAGTILYVFWPWDAKAPTDARKQITTATALFQDIHATVLATGRVMPQIGAEVKVGARISGRLDRLYVNVGDTVVKGQLIAEIEKKDLEAAAAEQRADVQLIKTRINTLHEKGPREIARAEAELDERLATLKFSQSEMVRHEELLRKGVVGKQEWEKADKAFKIAEAQVRVARRDFQLAQTNYLEGIKQLEAELPRAEAALENAEVKLSYAIIRAPINGVVGSVSTQEGETVAAGLNAPTFVTILDLERLQLNASVDEVDIGRISVGQDGFFTVDAFPEKEFKGRVSAIYPQAVIQDNVVTYDCVLSIETPYTGLLRPQMTANVTIVVEHRDSVLVLPVRAVKRRSGKSVVYQKVGDRIETVAVTTGWQDDAFIEITSGLSDGAIVFLESPNSTSNQ